MTSQLPGADVTRAYASQDFPLGAEHRAPSGAVYQFCQANGAITQYQVCLIPDNYDAVPCTTALSGTKPQAAGIAMATLSDNQWGFFAVGPFGTADGIYVSTLASCVADIVIGTTATAGAVDDTFTDQIDGLAIDSTNGGSTANVLCYAVKRMGVNSGGIVA